MSITNQRPVTFDESRIEVMFTIHCGVRLKKIESIQHGIHNNCKFYPLQGSRPNLEKKQNLQIDRGKIASNQLSIIHNPKKIKCLYVFFSITLAVEGTAMELESEIYTVLQFMQLKRDS